MQSEMMMHAVGEQIRAVKTELVTSYPEIDERWLFGGMRHFERLYEKICDLIEEGFSDHEFDHDDIALACWTKHDLTEILNILDAVAERFRYD